MKETIKQISVFIMFIIAMPALAIGLAEVFKESIWFQILFFVAFMMLVFSYSKDL